MEKKTNLGRNAYFTMQREKWTHCVCNSDNKKGSSEQMYKLNITGGTYIYNNTNNNPLNGPYPG